MSTKEIGDVLKDWKSVSFLKLGEIEYVTETNIDYILLSLSNVWNVYQFL